MAVILGLMLFTGTGFAKESLHDQYHVYQGDTYIGTVTDPGMIEQVKDEKLQTVKQEHADLDLVAGRDVSMVQEKVFGQKTADDEETVQRELENRVAVETEAVAVVTGGETAVHVKDRAAFDELLKQLKLAHVTKEELAAYELMQKDEAAPAPLSEGETRVIGINLLGDLQADDVFTAPERVLDPEQAAAKLLAGKPVEKDYTVLQGDAPETIAKKHGIRTDRLLELNSGMTANSLIHPGDVLKVPGTEPYVQVAVTRETKESAALPHRTVTEEDASLLKGETEVKQQGTDGKKEVTTVKLYMNGDKTEDKVTEEKVLAEPVDEIIRKGTKVLVGKGSGRFIWPAQGGYISSQMGARWGRQHNGIDIARPSGRSIQAADGGTVKAAGPLGGFGNRIEIDHGNGYTTLYAHLASINVKPGQKLAQGTQIGVMGSTGHSTGLHLHFEVRKNGALINPLSVVSQ